MSFTDILIILGCVAAGYWIVSSVMGPGIDITRQQKPADEEAHRPEARGVEPRHAKPQPRFPVGPHPSSPPRPSAPSRAPGMPDWYLLLDVSQSASRAEIEAAFLRQQKKAQADRDAMLLERLKRARDAGVAHARQGVNH